VAYTNATVSATYTSQANASGGDTFTYRATDTNALASDGTVKVAFDVTARTTATRSGLVLNRVTGTYNGTILLRNIGATAIAGPVQLLLKGLPTGVTMANAAGTFQSVPYLLTGSTLAPGAAVSLPVQFRNPANARISYTLQIISGGF
jgi:hypothetical protein